MYLSSYGVSSFLLVALLQSFTTGNVDCTQPEKTQGARAGPSLKLVFVVSRHGNRGASVDCPLDPYLLNNSTYWPYGPMALTPVGRVQAYNLGVKLRSLYDGFLPSRFYSDDIYACSDLYERVVMTAQLVLAGLYPPQGFQVWNKDIKWQPIAVYTNSSDRTKDLDEGRCKKYNQEYNKSMSVFMKDNFKEISQLIASVYKLTGLKSSIIGLSNIFDKLISEETEGFTLPDWTKGIYPDPFTSVFLKGFLATYAGTDKIVRLLVGEILDEIIAAMKNKVHNSLLPDRKMIYYSAHDDTVLSLQVALGVPRSKVGVVKVGSALIIELRQNPGTVEHYVQALYVDGSTADLEPVSLFLPACGDPCDFSTFVNLTKNFTDVHFDKECQINES